MESNQTGFSCNQTGFTCNQTGFSSGFTCNQTGFSLGFSEGETFERLSLHIKHSRAHYSKHLDQLALTSHYNESTEFIH